MMYSLAHSPLLVLVLYLRASRMGKSRTLVLPLHISVCQAAERDQNAGVPVPSARSASYLVLVNDLALAVTLYVEH